MYYFGFFIFNFNENSSDISVLLSHITTFSHIPRRNWGVCHIVGRAFSFSVKQKSVSCAVSRRVKSFHLTIVFKFVAHRILLQRWKQMITLIPLSENNQYRFFRYKTLHQVDPFFGLAFAQIKDGGWFYITRRLKPHVSNWVSVTGALDSTDTPYSSTRWHNTVTRYVPSKQVYKKVPPAVPVD